MLSDELIDLLEPLPDPKDVGSQDEFFVGGLGMIKKSRDWLVEDGSNSHGQILVDLDFSTKKKAMKKVQGGSVFFFKRG